MPLNIGAEAKKRYPQRDQYLTGLEEERRYAFAEGAEWAFEEALRIVKSAGQSGYVPWMGQNDWVHGKKDAVRALKKAIEEQA